MRPEHATRQIGSATLLEPAWNLMWWMVVLGVAAVDMATTVPIPTPTLFVLAMAACTHGGMVLLSWRLHSITGDGIHRRHMAMTLAHYTAAAGLLALA